MTNEEMIKNLSRIMDLLDMYIDLNQSLNITQMEVAYLDLKCIVRALEQQPCEDYIRELIREFDNKHLALFDDYMEGFNEHTISEIIDYMWDMHNLIEDIKYRLPNEEG